MMIMMIVMMIMTTCVWTIHWSQKYSSLQRAWNIKSMKYKEHEIKSRLCSHFLPLQFLVAPAYIISNGWKWWKYSSCKIIPIMTLTHNCAPLTPTRQLMITWHWPSDEDFFTHYHGQVQHDDFEDEPCDNDDNQFVYGCTFVTQHAHCTPYVGGTL